MAKHILIDCTLTKNNHDGNTYMDYLVEHKFVHNVNNLPYGILPFAFPFANDDYIDYVRNKLSVQKITVPYGDDNWIDMAVLINMDCTRIELLINANGESSPIERSVARKALVKYLGLLDFGNSDDSVVFHLGEVLRDAFNETKEELPSGENYTVVDTPFHGDIVGNILNNISIFRHDKKIERVIMEAFGITREQAKFEHSLCHCGTFSRYSTYFDYRDVHFVLILSAYEYGQQSIEVSTRKDESRVKVNDIHDLKSVIDQNFFKMLNNDAPEEAPKEEPEAPEETTKEEPEAEPKEAPQVEPESSVSIKANTYIEAFSKKANEIIAHTEQGKDWHTEFSDTASPKEVVGYYLYTYGISNALEKWRNNHEDTEFADEVNKIFDSIFCPFCKQGKPCKFDSSNDMYLERPDLHDNKVDCYAQGKSYVGTMVFPNCPLCGDKLEKK